MITMQEIEILETEYDLQNTKLMLKEERESATDPFNVKALEKLKANLEGNPDLTSCEQQLLEQTKSMINYVYYLRNRGE